MKILNLFSADILIFFKKYNIKTPKCKEKRQKNFIKFFADRSLLYRRK